MIKRALLIGGVVVLTVGAATVSSVWGRVEQEIGISEAPAVSHTELVGENTWLRVVVDPEGLNPLLAVLLEENPALPDWLPLDSPGALAALLPNEVALLGAPDYSGRKMDFTLFINERRGGVALKEALNQATVWQDTPLEWQTGPFVLEERGRLIAKATLRMPPDTDALRRERWPEAAIEAPLSIQGGHTFEASLDNRSGDLFALVTALAQASGSNWNQLLSASAQVEQLQEILEKAKSVHVTADVEGTDTLKLHFRIDATPDAEADFAIIPFAIPIAQGYVQEEYGMGLEGSGAWNAAEQAFIADFTLTGVERKLRDYLASQRTATPPATPPADSPQPVSAS